MGVHGFVGGNWVFRPKCEIEISVSAEPPSQRKREIGASCCKNLTWTSYALLGTHWSPVVILELPFRDNPSYLKKREDCLFILMIFTFNGFSSPSSSACSPSPGPPTRSFTGVRSSSPKSDCNRRWRKPWLKPWLLWGDGDS